MLRHDPDPQQQIFANHPAPVTMSGHLTSLMLSPDQNALDGAANHDGPADLGSGLRRRAAVAVTVLVEVARRVAGMVVVRTGLLLRHRAVSRVTARECRRLGVLPHEWKWFL